MCSDDVEDLRDWTDKPFSQIAEELLENGRRCLVRINGNLDELSITELGDNWIFTHVSFPDGSIMVSALFCKTLTPKSVIPYRS